MSATTTSFKLTIATFEHCQDNQPQLHNVEWQKLANRLIKHRQRTAKDGPAWSPTIYREGATRGKDGVESVNALVLDYDHGEPPWALFAGFEYAAHTTHSHRPDAPKWRVVLPLARPVPANDWPDFWRRARAHFGPTFDESCKDASRIFYLPSCPPGTVPDTRINDGAFLDPGVLPAVPEPALHRERVVVGAASQWDTKYVQSAIDQELAELRAAQPGGRNNRLNTAAYNLGQLVGGGAVSRADVESALLDAAIGNGLVHDDGEHAVLGTIKSGLDAGEANPRMAPARNGHAAQPPNLTSNHRDLSLEVRLETTNLRRWPDPLDSRAFHGVAGAIVQAIEPFSEGDPAALLAHVLTMTSILIGGNVHAVAGDAIHPARLNAVIVGTTSKGRKGSSALPIRRVLRMVESDFESKRILQGLSSGEGLIWQVRDPITKRERIKGDGPPQYQDVEVDGGIADKRLLVVEPEFASALRVMQRDGNNLSAIIRLTWDSGDLRTLTKNSPAVATGAHIGIIGHVTKDELLRYLDRSELASGFANRFLWIAAKRARVLPDGEATPVEVLESFGHQLSEVVEWCKTPRVLGRDAEATELWRGVYESLSDGAPGMFGAATSRAEAQVLRLSVLYAALDCSETIRAEHLLAALAVWEYAAESARWIFGDATGDDVADTILAALRQNSELSRDAIYELFGRHVSRDRITRALTLLLTAGLAHMEKRATGGRPMEVWRAG